MKPVAGEAKLNHAAAAEPKSGHRPPAGPKGHSSEVGNETKANVKGAQVGQPMDHMAGAVAELRGQHPHAHDDHGPHHNDRSHIRHKPYSMR